MGLDALAGLQVIGSRASLPPLLAIVELGRVLLVPGAPDPDRVRLTVAFGSANPTTVPPWPPIAPAERRRMRPAVMISIDLAGGPG